MALDIFILALVVVGGILGYQRGILAQVGSIVAVLAGIVAARMLGPRLVAWFAGAGEPGVVDIVSGYGLVFFLAYLLVWLVARMVRSAFRTVKLGVVDKLAGALFRIAEWLLLLSLALNFFIIVTSGKYAIREAAKPWRGFVIDFAPEVLGYVADFAHNNVGFPDVNSIVNSNDK